jgi:hypothetical protein
MHKIRIKRPYQKPVVVVNTDDESLIRILYAFYNPFIQNPMRLETVSEDRTVEITYEAKIGLFTCQGSTIKIPRGYALQAIENILFESTTVDEEILAIHGAVVGLSDKAFILTGTTGSGKSTLTAYLVKRGFDYLSDDLALIRKKDKKIIPFPRPIQLREGGAEVLTNCGIDVEGEFFEYGDIKRKVVYASYKNSEYSLAGIFKIARTKDIQALSPLSSQEGFLMLLKNQYTVQKPDPSFVQLLIELAKAGTYELNYSRMDYVEEVLRGTVHGSNQSV